MDKAGTVYKPHRHEKTYLYTLGGSLKIRVENNDWIELKPHQEFIIDDGELHEAIVGENGWEYVAAWDKEMTTEYGN
jgi:quercetin dioxygenase-like cupin family protein